MGKGEIARYEQFLLFQQCFQKTCTEDTWKPGLVWERVKMTVSFLGIGRKHCGKKGESLWVFFHKFSKTFVRLVKPQVCVAKGSILWVFIQCFHRIKGVWTWFFFLIMDKSKVKGFAFVNLNRAQMVQNLIWWRKKRKFWLSPFSFLSFSLSVFEIAFSPFYHKFSKSFLLLSKLGFVSQRGILCGFFCNGIYSIFSVFFYL